MGLSLWVSLFPGNKNLRHRVVDRVMSRLLAAVMHYYRGIWTPSWCWIQFILYKTCFPWLNPFREVELECVDWMKCGDWGELKQFSHTVLGNRKQKNECSCYLYLRTFWILKHTHQRSWPAYQNKRAAIRSHVSTTSARVDRRRRCRSLADLTRPPSPSLSGPCFQIKS